MQDQTFSGISHISKYILDILDVGMALVDPETSEIIIANQKAAELAKLPVSEMVGKPLCDLIGTIRDDKEDDRDTGTNTCRPRKVLSTSSGESIPVLLSHWEVEIGGGRYRIVIFLNVSDILNIEQLLREREKYLEAVLNASQDAIVTTDRNKRIIEWNRMASQIFGYTAEEAKGRDVDELLAGDSYKQEAKDLSSVVLSGFQLKPTEGIRFHKNGSPINVRISGAPVFVNEQLVGVVGFYTDISQLKKTMCDLMESQGKFRAVTAAAQDAIIMIDNDGKITLWNPAAEKIFGYTAEEVFGKDLHDLLAPDDFHPAFKIAFERFRKTGEGAGIGRILELSALHKNGSEFPIELSLSAVKLNGKWHGVGILRDITERKKAEAELAKSREKALEASRAKSEFLARMSHEIRTPMNIIIGMTELLSETSLKPEQQKCISILQSAGESLLSLINDILDISKIEAGRLNLVNTEFNLHELLEQVCQSIKVRTTNQDIDVICRIGEGVPEWIYGDPNKLRQILLNLLSNAAKFTEQGEIVLSVDPDREKDDAEDGDVRLLFSVSDTGTGIPEDMLDSIFDRFTQVDSSHTRTHEGTGLGLAITKRLVEMMKGRIWVESELGSGSTFFFTAIFGKVPDGMHAENEEPNLQGLNVLVAEAENAGNDLVISDVLRTWGADVFTVGDAEEAIREAAKAGDEGRAYDLILLDDSVTDVNASDIAETLKSDPAGTSPGIVLITSSPEVEKGETKSVDAILSRPVDMADLARVLHRILHDESRPDLPERPPSSGEKPDRVLRILLTEDSEDNRFLFTSYLKNQPVVLDIAENGRIAVEKFKTNEYDMVLMDIQMPIMDGYTATKLIREYELEKGSQKVPIIALTAYALKNEIEKCIEVGCTSYLSKPIRKKVFLDAISKYGRISLARTDRKPLLTEEPSPPDDDGEARPNPKTTADETFEVKVDADLWDLIPGYLDNRRKDLEKLETALEKGDFDSIKSIGHSMKGSGGAYGFDGITEIGAALEQCGKSKDEAGTRKWISALENYIRNVKTVRNE